MKVSDYIVDFLIKKGVTDIFGYPGGMVTHFMDSLKKRETEIHSHVNYHEQGAAFAACGYAQAADKVGVAYATSGPGATNLITGICNAYFDSIPVLFLTGQVNTTEARGNYQIRQRGFQETDIVSMVKGVTKYSCRLWKAEDVEAEINQAWEIAQRGRKGPVLLDIPMDVFRAEMEPSEIVESPKESQDKKEFLEILEALEGAKRPCVLVGAGLKNEINQSALAQFVERSGIPVVTSMIAVDVPKDCRRLYYGFIGAYGSRTANFIVAKCDVLLTLGARLDVRQVGAKRENFAPNAKILRVDIDQGELNYAVRTDETDICADAGKVLDYLNAHWQLPDNAFDKWIMVCRQIQDKLASRDSSRENDMVESISRQIPSQGIITTDVGQNQVWVAQSFVFKGQRILFSGGHGAMGYSLPAAIGAHYATDQVVFCFNGDGGLQMNIQELQLVSSQKLPIKVLVFNNHSLGMIRHFQEMYFSENYTQTTEETGYGVPNLKRVAEAYGIPYYQYTGKENMTDCFRERTPALIELLLDDETYVFPKLEFGKPNQDQEPLLERQLYTYLMEL